MSADRMPDRCLKVLAAWLLAGLLLFAVSGCASGKLHLARQSFYNGNLERAAAVLGDGSEISGRDRLLYFMENGVIAHQQQDYKASTRMFRRAVALMEELSVISASRQSGSLVTSEWLTRYAGEYAERLWVHTYLMMNYLLLNDPESALVEARQALEVFSEHPDALQSAHFTRALIAHCFEANGEYNGAFIEYKKLAEQLPNPAPVADKLVWLASRLGFADAVKEYSGYMTEAQQQALGKGAGPELLIFECQGRAPVKIPQNIVLPPSIRFSFVTYRERSGRYHPPIVDAAGAEAYTSRVSTDLSQTLHASLKARAAKIIAKETARVAAKEAISQQIEDSFIEILVRGVFFIMEEPDTRCWQTLPAYWTLMRVAFPPGRPFPPALTVESAGMHYRIPAFHAPRRFQYAVIRQGLKEGLGKQ